MSNKPANQPLFNMNLQLFGIFDPSDMPSGENPLTAVAEPSEPQDNPVEPIASPNPEPQPFQNYDVTSLQNEFYNRPVAPTPVQAPQNFDMKSYMDEMVSKLSETLRSQQNTPVQAEAVPQLPTEEELEKLRDELRDKLIDDPLAVKTEWQKEMEAQFEQKLQDALKPMRDYVESVQKNHDIMKTIENFRAERQDFDDYIEDIQKIFRENPALEQEPDALQKAYDRARSSRLDTLPKSPQDVLRNQEWLSAIMSDENVRNAVVTEYLKGVRSGQPPAVVGGRGGVPVISQGEEVKNLKDATKGFKSYLDGLKLT